MIEYLHKYSQWHLMNLIITDSQQQINTDSRKDVQYSNKYM